MPFDTKTDGIFAAHSADGFRFTNVGRVLPLPIDNPAVADWDQRFGKYVIFTRVAMGVVPPTDIASVDRRGVTGPMRT